jgi:hypothetical protein
MPVAIKQKDFNRSWNPDIQKSDGPFLYNKVIDVVTESIKDDISHAVTGCNCSDSSLVRKITKRVIEEFITQWVSEKIKNPQNIHLDEI